MVPSVCVVGGGVIGMTTAVNIVSSIPAVHVTVMAERFSPDTTSDVAAGFCFPHKLSDTPKHLVRQWFGQTFAYLLSVYNSPAASEAGVSILTGYLLSSKINAHDVSGLGTTLGLRNLTRNEVPLCATANAGGITFTTMLAEGIRFLPWLMNTFEANGGRVIRRRIEALSELYDEFDIIVNCTGIGAKQLIKDESVKPIRGQLITVAAPWIKHFYIDDEFYVIPGISHVTLGGTAQEGDWNMDVNETDRERIWQGCVRLVPSLQRARVIQEKVGLRPCRPKVRLERDNDIQHGTKTVQIIHNYGHGGAGVTLSWGCALDAVRLVNDCLSQRNG